MNNKHSKIEVLAPCGDYDILIAAVHAGADACYIGGNSLVQEHMRRISTKKR